MNEVGKLLIIAGMTLAFVGAAVLLISKTPLGKLPGDIVVERKKFTFAFPLATCILISVVLTLVLWIIAHLRQ